MNIPFKRISIITSILLSFMIAGTRLLAGAVIPEINVNDVAFGDLAMGLSLTKEVHIINTGDKELIVTGYSGPSDTAAFHITGLPVISKTKPLKIPADGGDVKFSLKFTPTSLKVFTDSLVFKSNADPLPGMDSICRISGMGKPTSLYANSYDWGRRTIDRPGFPAGPYPTDTLSPALRIENHGSQQMIISGIVIDKNLGGDAFEFDRSALNNMKLNPGKGITVPVVFHPKDTAGYELTFHYNNNTNSPTQTTFSGIGVVPKMIAEGANFGLTKVNDPTSVVTRTVRIINMKWNYEDLLIIRDIRSMPNENSVSEDLNSFGAEGYRFNKAALNLPVTLLPGDTLEFQVEFSAKHEGDCIAELRPLSNAIEDISIKLTGKGTNESSAEETIETGFDLQVTGNPARQGASDQIQVVLPYYSNIDLVIIDMNGNNAAKIFTGSLDNGIHKFSLPGNLVSGTYICSMTAGKFKKSVKFQVSK